MILIHRCKKCGKLVFPWQNCASITLTMKNGKKKVMRLCITCGEKIANMSMQQDR